MVTTIGVCSQCGGDVQVQSWHHSQTAAATCASCGATRETRLPVIQMRPLRAPHVVEVSRA
jgi:hypothetical protein